MIMNILVVIAISVSQKDSDDLLASTLHHLQPLGFLALGHQGFHLNSQHTVRDHVRDGLSAFESDLENGCGIRDNHP
jgi:hypothetical protein